MTKEIQLCSILLRNRFHHHTLVLYSSHRKPADNSYRYKHQSSLLLASRDCFNGSKFKKCNGINQKFISTSSLLFQQSNDNTKQLNAKTSSTTTPSDAEKQVFSPLNVKVKVRNKTDYTQSYTANNYLTTVRAFNEFLLGPSDLEGLPQFKRRNPFDEYGNSELMNMYLRRDVMQKAITVWGSLANLEKEKEKRRIEYEERRKAVFHLKKSLRDYHNRIEQLENPYTDNQYSNTTIYKTLSGKVVLSAVAVNGTNFIVKLVGWLYSGSSSLFSEAVHSLADTINQLILAFGLHQSLKRPNHEHPYGYSNMTYITSLISGVGIFCFGTGLSWYHGIMGLYDPHPVESLSWALMLLLGSAVSESGTLALAYMDTKQNAKKLGLSFWDYVIQGYKPSVNVVLLEDIAAVAGVIIAGSCMTLTHYTGNHVYDCVGSLLIGGLMGGVASFIIYTNTVALVGRSIPTRKIRSINDDLESDIMIRSVHDIKATDLGGQMTMFKAEVDIDGREITRSYLENIVMEKLLTEIDSIQTTQDVEAFMLRHGENIVDRVGAEIDRIERNLRKKYPDLQHVDLEVL